MNRHYMGLVWCLAIGGLLCGPAFAGDQETAQLKEEVRQLKEKVESLQVQQTSMLEDQVEEYLEETAAWRGAQGDGGRWSQITIRARFLAVNQNTIALDPANRSVVNGIVDLDFTFRVTEELSLFMFTTANDAIGGATPLSGGFPQQFGTVTSGGQTFGPIAGPTFSGLFDGIGVNGSVPVAPGSMTVYEAGIRDSFMAGETKVNWELGKIDPRKRFLQNSVADDERTQFINNLFDDSPAVPWMSTAAGTVYYGFHAWASFGKDGQWTVNGGWFNAPGQWFNRGQLYLQVHWRGEVSGREMNVRLMGYYQSFFQSATGDGGGGGGVSFDYSITDKIDVFARIAANGGDTNPIEADFSFGALWKGPIGSRPDDDVGVALGFIKADRDVLTTVPKSTETTLEIYYRYMLEDGKLQITPHLMFVFDPGGNATPWQDDMLIILGVRFYVPF